jgi:predicted CopG family antitoxin
MAHKTLTISEDAYTALSDLKLEDESFTDVIIRLAKARNARPLSSFAGRWHGSVEETKANFDKLDRMWVEYGKGLKRKLSHAFGPANPSRVKMYLKTRKFKQNFSDVAFRR